jgi:hypothetical protein
MAPLAPANQAAERTEGLLRDAEKHCKLLIINEMASPTGFEPNWAQNANLLMVHDFRCK